MAPHTTPVHDDVNHFLDEVEMQISANRKVLDVDVYARLEQVAREARGPSQRAKALELLCLAA